MRMSFQVSCHFVFARHHEIFQLRLFKLAHAENEVARRDLVAERLADLGNAERQLAGSGVNHVLKLGKDSLCGFRPQIAEEEPSSTGPIAVLKHQVERPRFGQVGRAAVGALAVFDVVGAETAFAFAAVGHGIGKRIFMAGIVKNLLVGEDGGVKPLPRRRVRRPSPATRRP